MEINDERWQDNRWRLRKIIDDFGNAGSLTEYPDERIMEFDNLVQAAEQEYMKQKFSQTEKPKKKLFAFHSNQISNMFNRQKASNPEESVT